MLDDSRIHSILNHELSPRVCDLPGFFSRVERDTVILSKHQERGSKDVLEAVFAVKVEAGDGMSGHACRTCLSAAQKIHLQLPLLFSA